MIDRKSSIKKSALGLSANGGGGKEASFISQSKAKTTSISSTDSASTSGSFNDLEVAPPVYNLFDESHSGSSLLDDSGPHREAAVDVPDSFVGTIKQAPRYPPLQPQMPKISSFKPLIKPSASELPINRIADANPFTLNSEEGTTDNDIRINTNSINPVHNHMQPQPQTPSITKPKVFLCSTQKAFFLFSPSLTFFSLSRLTK